MNTESVGIYLPVRLARIAVYAMFFTNGAIFANWAARIPAVKESIGLSEAGLGFALLGVATGVLVALPLAGWMIARFSSRHVTSTAALLNIAILPVIALADSGLGLWAILFGFGATTGTMDMAMNAQAVEVEHRHGKPLMSSFHAAFSFGSFAGAGMGGVLAGAGFAPMPHFLIASGTFVVVVLFTARWLVSVPNEVSEGDDRPRVFSLPGRALWPLGAVVFAAAISEGAMADWSALYMREIVGTGAGVAATAFAAFSVMMALGRLIGDSLTARYNRVLLTRIGGGLAASGLGLALIFPETAIALPGFALVGAGVSFIIPLVYSTAGNLPGIPAGVGLAGVATIGYSAFLAGPPVIGLLAEVTSLRFALVVVAMLLATLVYSGKYVRLNTSVES